MLFMNTRVHTFLQVMISLVILDVPFNSCVHASLNRLHVCIATNVFDVTIEDLHCLGLLYSVHPLGQEFTDHDTSEKAVTNADIVFGLLFTATWTFEILFLVRTLIYFMELLLIFGFCFHIRMAGNL